MKLNKTYCKFNNIEMNKIFLHVNNSIIFNIMNSSLRESKIIIYCVTYFGIRIKKKEYWLQNTESVI